MPTGCLARRGGHNPADRSAPAPAPTIPDATRPLVASALACRRGERLLFTDISFGAMPGTGCIVRGANGSGKSSLLRIVAGLLLPFAGSVEGADDRHYCGHAHGLNPTLTLRENLRFWTALMGGDAAQAADAVGLARALDVPASALSAGQRQRGALARLLLQRRTLWLLDEPSAALDADGTALVAQLVDDHAAAGGIAVVATHRTLPIEAPTVEIELG